MVVLDWYYFIDLCQIDFIVDNGCGCGVDGIYIFPESDIVFYAWVNWKRGRCFFGLDFGTYDCEEEEQKKGDGELMNN